MKKVLIFTVIFVFFATLNLQAFDAALGGSLEYTLQGTANNEGNLIHSGKAIAFLGIDLLPHQIYFEGSFLINYNQALEESEVYGNLDLAYLSLNFPIDDPDVENFSLSLGRFPFQDPTGYVLSQALDGLFFTSDLGSANISMFGAYNGLLNKKSSTMVLTNGDVSDAANQDNYFASPRLIAGLGFDGVFSDSSKFSLMYLYQKDLRANLENTTVIQEGQVTQDTTNGGLLDNMYLIGSYSFMLNPVTNLSFWAAGEYGQTMIYTDSYQYVPVISGAGGLNLILYTKEFLGSFFNIKLLSSLGDGAQRQGFKEGSLFTEIPDFSFQFKPLTSARLGSVFNPTFSNISLAELGFTLMPGHQSRLAWEKNNQISIKNISFFRTTPGPISAPAYDEDSTSLYLGNEVNISWNFRPFSDFGLYLSLGVFIPANGEDGIFQGYREDNLETTGSLFASWSF